MTGAIGHLAVDLSIQAGRVEPRITLRPGMPISRLLIGRTRAEAVTVVPAVLNLCASAHREAASAAVGLGGCGSGGGSRWETIRDHALAILRDWPACLGFAASRDGLGELAALSAGRDRAGALTALRRRICGDCSDPVRFEPSDLDRWLAKGETSTARVLAHVRRHFDPAWGCAALPAPTLGVIAAVASGDATARCEVTCADRVRGEPLPAGVEALEGRSLFVRLLGRLTDLLRCLDGRETGSPSGPPGFGFAQASRGMLVHSARLDGNTITGYRIMTPTDWNLAEGGLLHSMLASLPPDDRLEPAARLALACVDPCVPTTLTVRHA